MTHTEDQVSLGSSATGEAPPAAGRRSLPSSEQLERELELTQELAAAASESETLDIGLRTSLGIICRAIDWDVGQAWMPRADGEELRCRAGWASGPGFEAMLERSEQSSFPQGKGLAGIAWEAGVLIWVPDMRKEASLPRRDAADAAGLVSAMALPVFASGHLTAVFEFFVSEPREQDEPLARLTSAAAAQLGPLIRLKDAHDQLDQSGRRYRALAETAFDAIVSADSRGRISYLNPAARGMFGFGDEAVVGRPLTVLMPERYHSDHRRGLARYLATGKGRSMLGHTTELAGRRTDGSEFPIEVSLAGWEREGERHVTGIMRDVSERKTNEQRLLERDAQLAEAQSIAELGSWEWEAHTKILRWSEEMFRIFGLEPTAEPPPTEEVMRRVHPDDVEHLRRLRDRAIEERKEGSVFHRVVRSDGEVRILHARAKPIVDAEGVVVRVLGTTQDVTERERAVAERREAEKRFRVAFDSAPIGVVLKDPDGRIQDVNGSFSYSMGYSLDELRGTSFMELLDPADRGGAERAIERLLTGELDVYRAERRYRHRDGRWVDVRLSEALARGEDGQPLYLIAQWEDVTEAKRVQEALGQSRERLQAILDHTPSAVFMKDLDGTYVLANRRACAMFGAEPEQILGSTDHELFPADVADAIRANDQVVLERGDALTVDGWFPGPKGQRTVRTERFPVFDENGSIYAIGGISSDVTDRLRAEEEKVRLEGELQEARRLETLGRLAGGVAHDFNNLLAIILNYAALAEADAPAGSPLQKDIGEMRGAARRAADLTHELLLFSCRQPVQRNVVSIAEVLHDAQGLLGKAVGEAVELRLAVADGLRTVEGEGGQLERVLVNLILNARDAMPRGGQVTVGADNVTLDAESGRSPDLAPGRYVRLWVSDTGEGMTEEVAARALDPFFTTKPMGQGTGLGLATVYGIVTQAGGSLELDSRPGQGSTVTLHLPVARRPPVPQPDAEPRKAPPGQGEVILIVEDQDAIRRSISRMLAGAGYRVEEAQDPALALELCADEGRRVDLVLTDVVMPSMSGAELAERLGEVRPDLAVLFMSGHTDEIVASQGVDGDPPFLAKPFAPEQLLDFVHTLVRGKAAHPGRANEA